LKKITHSESQTQNKQSESRKIFINRNVQRSKRSILNQSIVKTTRDSMSVTTHDHQVNGQYSKRKQKKGTWTIS